MTARFTKYALIVAALVAVSSVAGAQAKAPASKVQAPASKVQAHAAVRTDASLDRSERAALKSASEDPKADLKGVKLSKSERTSVDAIVRKYSTQRMDLAKSASAARKAGTPDADFSSKVTALRDQERVELRAALPATAQAKFDKNVAARGK